jgi:hypothetical protein
MLALTAGMFFSGLGTAIEMWGVFDGLESPIAELTATMSAISLVLVLKEFTLLWAAYSNPVGKEGMRKTAACVDIVGVAIRFILDTTVFGFNIDRARHSDDPKVVATQLPESLRWVGAVFMHLAQGLNATAVLVDDPVSKTGLLIASTVSRAGEFGLAIAKGVVGINAANLDRDVINLINALPAPPPGTKFVQARP